MNAVIDPLLDEGLEQGLPGFLDASDVVAELKRRALLFETDDVPFPDGGELDGGDGQAAFCLRQMFPRHAGPDGWQQAPTLVADFRFLWRRRRYPDRVVPVSDALGTLADNTRDETTFSAFGALLEERGEGYKLAKFQLRTGIRIIDRLEAQRPSGTLVSAGTGSGKTLAFYLPALARTAAHVARESGHWVRVAIYPRTELLRDQFAEI